ncbi:hypothetical protein ACNO8X_00995 [Mycobacterium sp. PDNC021]|uniref:DUF7159 family protein n=1 Tax=Mycobacterium sp. PDNC021 TaxID=3391399 RepID=UPI003AACDC5C
MTPTTVRMALVEGDKADGEIVDHDIFETQTADGSATPVEQVVSAILGTRESAAEGGHHLKSVGVAWSDHDAAARLRDALDAAGVKDVMMVSELHAAGSLAQAAGQAVGYSSTGLLFVDRDTATMSVVDPDGSISKVLSRSLHSTDAMAVLGDMAAAVASADSSPQGMFVVGAGVDVTAVQAHLAELLDIPVNAPGDADLALARGAALASANAPMFDAATAGLAYSAAPGGAIAAAPLAAPLLTADEFGFDELGDAPVVVDQGRKPFLLVGSALTSIFVVGVVALAISLAVSIRPTVDQRPAPAQAAIVPSAPVVAPVPPPAAVPPPAPAAVPEPAPEVVAPAPRHVEAPQVVKESAPQVHVPAPEAPAPAPVPVSMPDVPAAPVVPPPAAVPDPVPAVLPPPVIAIPGPQPPAWNPWAPRQRQPQWVDPGNNYPDYPSRGGRGHDDDGYPGNYPGNGYPGNQYPGNGYPGNQYPGGSNGYPGNQYPGDSDRKPKQPKQTCFLIFCAPK